ncbi:hypothetical protein UACE39S_03001 [Ureibacillus acetophenoni]
MHPLFHPLFIDYCSYFNGNQDYFECHEVLEEYWKEISRSDKNHPLVGYIQLATSMYHWRRQNLAGALRTLTKAYKNFQENNNSPFFDYIDYDSLINNCRSSIVKLEQDCPFKAFELQIINQELQTLVSNKIRILPKDSYHYLLNKHMLRDRSDILNARDLKRNQKNK